MVIKREPAEDNPWHSKSIEWQLPTPVPVYNFERIPVINSAPYSSGIPDAPSVADFGPSARLPGGPAITPEGGVL
jgi:cytochrome c oxidase subunit 1